MDDGNQIFDFEPNLVKFVLKTNKSLFQPHTFLIFKVLFFKNTGLHVLAALLMFWPNLFLFETFRDIRIISLFLTRYLFILDS